MDTRVYEYGNPDSSTVLLQMVDDHDLAVIENEVAAIWKTAYDCRLLAVEFSKITFMRNLHIFIDRNIQRIYE